MELGIDNSIDSPTYTHTKLITEEILEKSQISFMFFMRSTILNKMNTTNRMYLMQLNYLANQACIKLVKYD